MSWFAMVVAVAATTLVMFGPGLLIGALGGARRLYLWAIAPGISIGLIAALGILYPFLGVGWSTLSAVAGVIVVAAVVVLVKWLATRRTGPAVKEPPCPTRYGRYVLGAAALAAVITTVQLVTILGTPDAVSQTFDAAFHLNGVAYLRDHSSASSLELTGLILPAGVSSFYPAAWHAIAVTIVQFSGLSVPLIVNAMSIVGAALVFPAGVLLLVRVLLPNSRAALLAAGALAAAFPGFPVVPLDFGVLYPYFFALALLPSALAVTLPMLRIVARRREHLVLGIAALCAILVGIGLAQPSGVLAWGVLLIPAAIAAYLRYRSVVPQASKRVFAGLVLVVSLLGFAAVWLIAGRVGYSSPWWAYASFPKGLRDLFGMTLHGYTPAVLASLLTLLGVVLTLRKASSWWVGSAWIIAATLFFLSAVMPFWTLRNLLLGPFYKDPPRFFALLAVISIPLAVWGADALWRWWRARMIKARADVTPRNYWVAAVAMVLLVAVTQTVGMAEVVNAAQSSYALTKYSPLLSTSERALIERLPETTPQDAVIIGNPWTGTSFAYVLGHRTVVNAHFNSAKGVEATILDTRLNQALTDPSVCEAVRALGARYVLDFGSYTKDNGDLLEVDSSIGFEGLLNLADSGVVTEIDRESKSAVLYEITACG